MGSLKQIMIKNRTYYFYNDIIDNETFDSNMLKLDKKPYKDLDIYNIGYATIKKLRIDNANGSIEQINEDKYIIFDDTHENKKLLKRYDDVFNGIMSKIKMIDDDWHEYSKDYMKLKFNSDDNFSLNKP